MVTKVVNNDNAGNLNNAADFFGVQNDFIAVEVAGSTILTFAGDDLVDASRSVGVQEAILGFGNDIYYGGITGVDSVHDGDGNDFVDLSGGNDFLNAGAGNDVYVGGSGTDRLNFSLQSNNGYSGFVTNSAGVTVDLAKTSAQNFGVFGTDIISGFEEVEGSSGHDNIFGTNSGNSLIGNNGNDAIDGRGGSDTLIGGMGADTLVGGTEADTIFCGADTARDTIRYLALAESGLTLSARDQIFEFSRNAGVAGDRIDLRLIDANPVLAGDQNFVFIGTGAFRANVIGEVRIVDTGADVLVQIDADRDNGIEMTFLVKNVATLAAFDFFL